MIILKNRRLFNLLLISLAFTLSACGGGDSNNSTENTVPVPAIKIDSSNAATITKQTLSTMTLMDSTAVSATGGSPPIVVQQSFESMALSSKSMFDISNAAAITFNNIQLNTITTNAVTACSGGGSVESPDPGATSGTATITFIDCVEGTVTTNGSISIVVDASSTSTNANASVTFDITAVDSSDNSSASLKGGFDLAFSSVAGVDKASLSGALFSITASIAGVENFLELTDFNFSVKVDANTSIVTTSASYTVNSSELGGAVVVKTVVPFETIIGQANPYVGEVLVTGASGSKLQITVNAAGTGVTVMIDPDGNGFDPALTQEIPWADL